MADLVAWWLAIQVLGVVALPISLSLFKHLPDRGYALSKVLGLLLVGYSLWLAVSAGILPNARGSLIILALFIGLISLIVIRRQRSQLGDFLSRNLALIATVEVIFLALFLLWGLIRAYNPEIAHTEQPMDFAFLNTLWRSQSFPPADPWLSGHPVSYYYFGYLIMASLVKLSGVPTAVGYNLALASLFALTAIGAFSLVYNLVSLAKAGRDGKSSTDNHFGTAVSFGLIAVLFLLVVSNFEGVIELLRVRGFGTGDFWTWIGIRDLHSPYQSIQWYPTDTWWWWRATRIIGTVVDGRTLDYTITEFPFFSFLLGDLHPHVMGLPFALLALSLSLNLLHERASVGLSWVRQNPLSFVMVLVSLGALGFINSWDLPTYSLLFIAAAVMGIYWRRNKLDARFWIEAIIFALLVLLGAFILYMPFYRQLETQITGLFPVREIGTRPLHFFIFWGLFFFVTASFVVAVSYRILRRGRPSFWQIAGALIAVLSLPLAWVIVEFGIGALLGTTSESLVAISKRIAGLLLWLPLLFLTLLIMLRIAARLPSSGDPQSRSNLFALLLVFAGWGLTMVPELFYLGDIFGTRMNTVFKFYYQAWALLAIASAFSLYYFSFLIPGGRPGAIFKWGWIGVLVLLLAGTLAYPVAALPSKAVPLGGIVTLDGLAFTAENSPDDREAIQWLNSNIFGTPAIVEAVGGEYSEYGRVSARTGLPAVLGWGGHEVQWRGSDRKFRGREADIEQIYRSDDQAMVMSLLNKYQVEYVYLGNLERAKYGVTSLDKFNSFLDVVFQNRGVTIYRVRK